MGRSLRTEMEQDRLERLADAPIIELILACEDLDEAAEVIRGNDYMWNRVVGDVAENASSISSTDTADEVCREFLEAIARYARLGKMPDDDEAEQEVPADG